MKLMERLNKAVMEKGPLLAGLDPDMEKLRALSKEIGYKGADCNFLRDYCFEYIKAVKDTVVATKYFLGSSGENKGRGTFCYC